MLTRLRLVSFPHQLLWISLLGALVAVACGSPAGTTTGTETGGNGQDASGFDIGGGKDAKTGDVLTDTLTDAVAMVDAGGDAKPGDVAGGKDTLNAGDQISPDAPDGSATCEFPVNPGPGEPGATCAVNGDCDSGYCVDGADGKICTKQCVSCCPGGFSCAKASGADATFVCLPQHLALCAPCQTDAQCGTNEPGALCVNAGEAGSFCGSPCVADSDCPQNYACQDAVGELGQAKQCILQTGACGCSKLATLQGAATSCATTNGLGTCAGVRKCTLAGLTPCSAPEPATETCNGVDDDCDGKTDTAGAVGCVAYYQDNDQDGVGGAGLGCLCANPGNALTVGGDCNDSAAAVHPGAKELCDGYDNDCDGQTDPGFTDSNKDGFADCVDPDIDGDGVPNAQDCSPTVASVYPGAPESCDGLDNDCNGTIDDAGATGCTLWFQDADGDSAGTGAGKCLCAATGAFTAASAGDCNDQIAAVHPGAKEVCNDLDDDCNGGTDEGCDDDLDLWCDATMTVIGTPLTCSEGKKDCNDNAQGVNPGAKEICGNGVDDNCDGLTDTGVDQTGCVVYYVDSDADGFGDKSQSSCLCAPSALYSTSVAGDCNDQDAAVNAKSLETCNGKDDDCNGVIDDQAQDCKVYYQDADADTYGVTGDSKCLCAKADGYTALLTGDCNDAASAIHPKATEVCDTVDNDCDGLTDPVNSEGCTNMYKDADGDGYGSFQVSSKCLCAEGGGYVSTGGDCDDADKDVHPGATEACNGKDDNCDLVIDPKNAAGCTTYYVDGDGDTYGASTSQCTCKAEQAFTATVSGDCDDTQASAHPGATEVCDGLDNNCNALTDEGLTSTFYTDVDGDGYGTGGGVQLCSATQGFGTQPGDCDDTDKLVNPGLNESCDGKDNNCNAQTDEGLPSQLYYADADKDGCGAGVGQTQCGPSAGFPVTLNGDCADGDAAIHPGATEACNLKDDNCDGQTDEGASPTTWYADADKDTFGNPAVSQVSCGAPAGYVADKTDCDDTNASIKPTGLETCNSKDDNCNGTTDEGGVCTVCSATVLNGLDKSGDATLVASRPTYSGWAWDGAGEWSATQGTTKQYLRWGDIGSFCGPGCGYYYTTAAGDSATWTVNVPANANFIAIDYSLDNHYDESAGVVTPDTTMYLKLTFDGVTKQIGPFPTWQGPGWKTLTWPVSAQQQGKSLTMKAVLVATVTSNTYQAVGAALDNVRAISGCTDPANFCGGPTGGASQQTWYTDADGDGYGATAVTGCMRPAGAVLVGGDCDDTNAALKPGATEISCNGIDEDCNGVTDDAGNVLNPLDAASDYNTEPGDWWAGHAYAFTQGVAAQWWGDVNGCGYHKGSDTLTFYITVPAGASAVAVDVYFDNRHSVGPDTVDSTAKMVVTINGATQQVGPFATIQTQKWRTLYFPMTAANAGKQYLVSATMTTTVANTSYGSGCAGGSAGGFGIDNARSVTAATWYKDADGDTYGDKATVAIGCTAPAGYVATSGDCNDADANIHPGITDLCSTTNVDDNCDGTTDGANSTGCASYYADADTDGFGTGTASCLCKASATYTTLVSGDCNDAVKAINPGAAETCNALDDNCNGQTDEGLPQGTWYRDADSDGYKNPDPALVINGCLLAGYVTSTAADDCLDTNATVHAGAAEVCYDSLDNNCDGTTDEGCPACSGSTLINGFNTTTGWTATYASDWYYGGTVFTPTEGTKCAYLGGNSGFSSLATGNKVTVTFVVPANKPFLTIDYVLDNLYDSPAIPDTVLKAKFTFNGQSQTVGPYATWQGLTVHQLQWPIPANLVGTTQTLVIDPTTDTNGFVLSGLMIDNLRATCQ